MLILVKGLGLGGVERLLSQSLGYLDRDRFDYEACYLTPWKDDVVPDFERAGIEITCLEVESDIAPSAFTKVRRFIRDGGYDIIHTHSPLPSSIARLVKPRAQVRGFVHTEHSLPGSRNLVTRLANRVTYPLCDVVIPVSQVVSDSVAGSWPAPKEIRLIHGGIDDVAMRTATAEAVAETRRSVGIPDGHRVVGNVAHLREQKGLEVWLEAAAEVARAGPATSFVLVGREKVPGYQETLESRAKRLGIEELVHFVGFQPDPYPYLGMFDVFLMSSEFEGFPIALVEAMAMGTPVVSTDVGGVREAVGDTALLTESGDSSGLAGHVIELLRDEARRTNLADRARTRARSEFTVESMVAKVEEVYEDLLRA